MNHDFTHLQALGQEVLDIEIAGLQSLKAHLNADFAQAVQWLSLCSGRIILTGIGKSGLVGRKIAATLSSTGSPAFYLHPVEGAHGDLGNVQAKDVVIAISYSGETVELNAILPAIKVLGAKIIALTGNLNSSLSRLADLSLNAQVPREACPHNLAPTASTTAVLALGDALAMCLMQVKNFSPADFSRYHPGGSLGQRLGLQVKNVMRTHNLPALSASCTQAEALASLNAGAMGLVILLTPTGQVAGVLTDGDVRRSLCTQKLALQSPVDQIMTLKPRLGQESDSVAALLNIMESKQITVLPIVDPEGLLLGIVHIHDLLGKGEVNFKQEPSH